MSYGSSNVTPAITDGADLFETLAFQHVGEIDQSSSIRRGTGDTPKEGLKVLFVLLVPGWQLLNSEGTSLPKEIGHEDLSAQGLSQDISPL